MLSLLHRYMKDEEVENLEQKKALHTDSFEGVEFIRVTKDHKQYPRGTVFMDDRIIMGYPRIMRVLHLGNGIRRYMKGKFYVEEKVDGYNVRITLINGRPLAFTRGGYVCPLTTSKVPDLLDMSFFEKYPDYVISGEVAGPGSPYNTEPIPYVSEDVSFFIFDLFDASGEKLSTEEKYSMLEPFQFTQVSKWGPFTDSDVAEVKDIVLELDRQGREGIVLKPVTETKKIKPIKYVTLSSCLSDLRSTTELVMELPAGFFMQRIIRAIFFCHEFGIHLDENYLLDAAKALYLSPAKCVKVVSEGGHLKESFKIKSQSKKVISEFMDHLNRSHIDTKLLSIEKINDEFEGRFQRIYRNGTKKIRRSLRGHGFFD